MRNCLSALLIILLSGVVLGGCATEIGSHSSLTSSTGKLKAKVFAVQLTPQGNSGVLRVDSRNNGCSNNPHKGCIRFPENTVGLMKFYLPGASRRAKTCDGNAKAVITEIEISVNGSGEKGDFDPANLPLPLWVETKAFPLIDRATGFAYKKDKKEGSNQVWLLNTNTNNPDDGPKVFWYRVKAESCKSSPAGPWTTDPRGENQGTRG